MNLIDLLENALEKGILTRIAFNEICTRTHNDGSCGFAIIVAILNHIGGIQKREPVIYSLRNKEKIQNLLA